MNINHFSFNNRHSLLVNRSCSSFIAQLITPPAATGATFCRRPSLTTTLAGGRRQTADIGLRHTHHTGRRQTADSRHRLTAHSPHRLTADSRHRLTAHSLHRLAAAAGQRPCAAVVAFLPDDRTAKQSVTEGATCIIRQTYAGPGEHFWVE